MSLALGLVGLPNAGKSTLFNALANGGATVANYPFTTIEPNIGVVPVPDPRLERIAAIVKPERVVPTTVEFVDIAGLVSGASHGEGLGNQFLGHIRNVDAVVMVLRMFSDPKVASMYDSVDPLRDADVIETELTLADLAMMERRITRAEQTAKSGERRALRELKLVRETYEHLAAGHPARTLAFSTPDEADLAREIGLLEPLLTAKPLLYVVNVGEDDLAYATSVAEGGVPDGVLGQLRRQAKKEGIPFLVVCAKLEAELAELSPEEAAEYRRALGVTESGLARLIEASYRLLDLVTFFTTTGGKEVRAWTVRRGTKAPQAAGKVHSDMERGFIRAEVISYEDLMAAGSFAEARERGMLRVEGQDYVVQNGDIMHFRFHV